MYLLSLGFCWCKFPLRGSLITGELMYLLSLGFCWCKFPLRGSLITGGLMYLLSLGFCWCKFPLTAFCNVVKRFFFFVGKLFFSLFLVNSCDCIHPESWSANLYIQGRL